jgi:hypothetical protein
MLDLRTIFDPDRVAPAAVPPFCKIPDDLPPDWHFLWDERAATMEYDAGLARERAEALALADILNLMHSTGRNARS